MKKTIIQLSETTSTNDFLRDYADISTEEIVVATADYQKAGRGQGANTWESENGKNLLFSILISPTWLLLRKQFLLSMCGALAIKTVLDKYTEGITVKWPNDIYWHDKKISGTLIETSLSGKEISRCVIGVGVNINQEQFHSDAPNPVSLWQIIGKQSDREQLLSEFIDSFELYYLKLREGCQEEIVKEYHENLYRRNGFHEFIDKRGAFMARIVEVKENGRLVLSDINDKRYEYELKEIQHGKV